jgi:DnaJ like chaperone protein
MTYRGNLGCLWIALLLALVGGSPLLLGVLRLFAFFALVLVIGGGIATWWLRRNAVRVYTGSQTERHNRFVELLVALLVRLAQLDGELDRREVTVIRQFFQERLGYRDERLAWLRDLIKEARRDTTSVEELTAELAAAYGLQERLIVVQVLALVAQADGHVSRAESDFIEKVAVLLGLGPFVRGFGFEQGGGGGYRPGPSPAEKVDEALGVLGLDGAATPEEIKAAWRRLSKENHPDRVTHLGEEFRAIAEERMRKINAAYDVLKEAGRAS